MKFIVKHEINLFSIKNKVKIKIKIKFCNQRNAFINVGDDPLVPSILIKLIVV